ncbi:Mpv17 / PMP22 family [Phytophthora infestans]|uniref:Mpv17 / PMP22 family n=1 Tax=Phytophthora infestans TaxID=4787 RepID=A0A833TPD1_PHYIN|nr:Mpv17 / PMP22 family [Phytophthora infestans]KAF4144457.1 Mpv17 / PMP22 family [Phytophthora infestans]
MRCPLGGQTDHLVIMVGSQKYQLALQTNPLRTKAVTSAGVAMLGEVLGHVLKHNTLRGLSLRQMLAFFAFGGIITGPMLHVWYGYLENQRVTKEKLVPKKDSQQKLLLDRLLFTPPMVAFTLFSLGVMRGSSPKASRENLSRVYWDALLMNWKLWTVTQWLSFKYVPPQLWGNCAALWWNSYLSLTQ